jgi:hypothetical protein
MSPGDDIQVAMPPVDSSPAGQSSWKFLGFSRLVFSFAEDQIEDTPENERRPVTGYRIPPGRRGERRVTTVDYTSGVKKDVAEIKFLIHDLRVQWFFNEVIHYHVTLTTELEIYGLEEAHHGGDLARLKYRAQDVRSRHKDYAEVVKVHAPDETVLIAGQRFIQAVFDMCRLILNPAWGRIDAVLAALPAESRSVRSRSHYRNCILWICGVSYRLEHFLAEQRGEARAEAFDIADELQYFTRNVVYGYVVERSAARVELRLERLDPGIVKGRRHRFRRMFFNLIMNAVEAMKGRTVGVIHISTEVDGEQVTLRVRDDGAGMTKDKVAQLMEDKRSLDGELHSLGFVFVRQTVREFGGELSISSRLGRGTTIEVTLPHLPGATPVPREPSKCEEFQTLGDPQAAEGQVRRTEAESPASSADESGGDDWGQVVLEDYRESQAASPGCIFAMAVNEKDEVDFFTHRPYEKLWNITHEDLSPMFFEATVRGRLEEDKDQQAVLVLKAPQNVREYFEFKEVPEAERSSATHLRMVHDEYIRIGRKLVGSGMDAGITVHLTDLKKFFPDRPDLIAAEPFTLEVLAAEPLSSE